ncbi:LysE family translocator [Anoxybacteroides tepidamans]|uniref:LysE family translocator n=1 Tax=Anoxybacteroides tepidamans TaxID=265948 RepID=UPI00048040A2|nr:LysE family transporter [Anoxybacillus tepidamans]
MDLLKGLIIGFSIAAPVGPIGILCIQRTLAQGRLFGFVSGLGAATADAIYGLVAGLGLTVFTHFLVEQQTWIRLIGGLFLAYLGIRTLMSGASEAPANARRGEGIWGAYFSILFLTFSNPMTILSFAAIFSSFGISHRSTFVFVGGVFIGSALWWLFLSGFVGFVQHRIQRKYLTFVNRVSGMIILVFAVGSLYSLL